MKYIKYITALTVSILLSFSFTLSSVRAQEEAVADAANQIEEGLKSCARGFTTNFLATGAGFADIISSWEEIFEWNACYKGDLDGVGNQLRKVRKEVRSAYLTCNLENKDRIFENYWKLDAELWFLRYAIDTKNNILLQNFVTQKQKQKIYQEMVKKYGDVIDEKLMDQYVTEFHAKYTERFEEYKTCRTFQSLDELEEKWEEFLATMGDFVKAIDDLTGTHALETPAEKRERKRREALDADKEPQGPSLLEGPDASLDRGLDASISKFRLNVEAEKTLGELEQEWKDQFGPSAPKSGPGGIGTRIVNEKRRVEEELALGEMWIRYRTMYGQVADKSTEGIINSLKEFGRIIPDTVPSMLKVQECSKKLKDRQCSSKQ